MVGLLLWLLLLYSSNVHEYQCGKVNLTGSWGFPLGPVESSCNWLFQFPPGVYAQMYFKAVDMGNYDTVSIVYDQIRTRGQKNFNSTFISNCSYVDTFYVSVTTDSFYGSKMQLQIQIELYPNNFGKNVQQTFYPGLNKPSGMLYFEDMVEGATYEINCESSWNYIQAGYIGQPEIELWNIWIYLNGKFLFSMYDLSYWDEYNPLHGRVSIYIAQKATSLSGALIFNDYDNYVGMDYPTSVYVPVDQPGHTETYYISSAVTIIGARDGSTPFDVRSLFTPDNPPALFTYLGGGVIADYRDNDTRLQQNQLPFHVKGNLNTFYVTGGTGYIKITVSN